MALLSEENCRLNAEAIVKGVREGSVPSWFQNNADWYSDGLIDCQTMVNATGWVLQEDIVDVGNYQSIFQEILQDANLVALGKSTSQRAEEIARNAEIREAQRLADQEAVRALAEAQAELNDLHSQQLVDLGNSVSEVSQAVTDLDTRSGVNDTITGLLGGIGAGSGIILLGLAALLIIKK